MDETIHNPQDGVFYVDGLFTAEECQQWINLSEEIGYEKAGITRGSSQVQNLSVRNNDRVIYDNKPLARDLFKRAKPVLPQFWSTAFVAGLNDRLRFYRYGFGQQFREHKDMSYQKNRNMRSEYTCMIYLNDDFAGGETRFDKCLVEPKCGRVLWFKHELVHEGIEVESGIKYVLRTDVMYRRPKQ